MRGCVGEEAPEPELEGDGAAIGLPLAGLEAPPAMEMTLGNNEESETRGAKVKKLGGFSYPWQISSARSCRLGPEGPSAECLLLAIRKALVLKLEKEG